MKSVRELSQAFALAVPHEDTARIRDDVAFFQAVQAVLSKRSPVEVRSQEELDHAVRQIISRALTSEGVVDIFSAAGLDKPDIPICASWSSALCAVSVTHPTSRKKRPGPSWSRLRPCPQAGQRETLSTVACFQIEPGSESLLPVGWLETLVTDG